jgi:hypothetical protein
MSDVSKPYSELYSPVRYDAPKIRSKNWRGAELVKDATKKLFFLTELKKNL